MSSRSTQKANNPLTVPGPAPWYLAAPEVATLQTSRGVWRWQTRHRAELETNSYLRAPDGSVALLVSLGCYVLPLPDERILVWHERKRSAVAGVDRPGIVFTVLHLNDLQPLADRKAAATAMRSANRSMAFEAGTPVVFEVPTGIGEGTHAMAPPAALRDVSEILVLGDYGSESGNGFDRSFRAIFAFDFKAGQVSVLPQRWFNEGKYDFSYQWITRVQREPETGQIVGEGIRIRRFRLDASGTQVQAWLDRDDVDPPPQGQLSAGVDEDQGPG